MPIHEYNCHQCDHHFEALVRKETVLICMRCGSADLTKKVSRFSARINSRAIKGGLARHCATCMGGDCSSCV